MNRRAALFWGGLVVALVLVGLLSGGRSQTGDPLDPDSTDPLGTRALMIFLDEFGAEVRRDLPDDSMPISLVLADQLTEEQSSELTDWVERGGTLVVSDPSSDLTPDLATPATVTTGSIMAGDCAVPELSGLTLEAASFVLYESGQQPDGGLCFGRGGGGYLHVRPSGEGRVVSLGGALALTNQNLDEADNAVLAARLLLPDSATGGPRTVSVLYEPIAAAGTRTLGDLIPSAAKWATWQLLVAFAVLVAWRAPRFGRPVLESQPVELPGSLLVRATGELHRRSQGHVEASRALRADLDRRLRRHLRASPELPVPELVTAAVTGNDADPSVVQRALAGPMAAGGDDLAALVADLDHVNDHVLTDRPMPNGDEPVKAPAESRR